jgi:Serine carboxypeptidase S28
MSHYRWGGPVILLLAGEANATFRLPTLQKGIVKRLAQATNGIGILLEHRYYGESQPMPDLSVESLRFLDTQQAMADTLYFAQHIKLPGLEWISINPKTTPWIVYGGSYAGAFAVS